MKKWIIGILALLLISTAAGYLWYKNKTNGSQTQVINPDNYFQKYQSIAISNVNLLSPDGTHFIENQNIILKNGKIESIGTLDSTIKTIDGTQKFLIPGLTDSHVHLVTSKNDLYLYLANGITTVWEMFGNKHHLKWKQNEAISPKIFVATSKVGSQKGIYHWGAKYFEGSINFTSETEAINGVKEFKKQGYDAIKLGSFLNYDIYKAIVENAELPVLGHLSSDIGLKNAYTSGITQIAHIEELVKNMSTDFGELDYENSAQFLDYVRANADSVAINLKENHIAVSTTIWLMESLPKQKFYLDSFIKTLELRYANPGIVEGSPIRKGWLPGNNSYQNLEILKDSARKKGSQKYWATYVKAIQICTEALARNKVSLLAGTDANATCTVPGFSLHDELISLTNAGLTPMETIQSATIAPAQFFKSNSGRIETGLDADLVLLNENPLLNIANTKTIETVFTGSHILTNKKKEELLEAIIEVNNNARSMPFEKY